MISILHPQWRASRVIQHTLLAAALGVCAWSANRFISNVDDLRKSEKQFADYVFSEHRYISDLKVFDAAETEVILNADKRFAPISDQADGKIPTHQPRELIVYARHMEDESLRDLGLIEGFDHSDLRDENEIRSNLEDWLQRENRFWGNVRVKQATDTTNVLMGYGDGVVHAGLIEYHRTNSSLMSESLLFKERFDQYREDLDRRINLAEADIRYFRYLLGFYGVLLLAAIVVTIRVVPGVGTREIEKRDSGTPENLAG